MEGDHLGSIICTWKMWYWNFESILLIIQHEITTVPSNVWYKTYKKTLFLFWINTFHRARKNLRGDADIMPLRVAAKSTTPNNFQKLASLKLLHRIHNLFSPWNLIRCKNNIWTVKIFAFRSWRVQLQLSDSMLIYAANIDTGFRIFQVPMTRDAFVRMLVMCSSRLLRVTGHRPRKWRRQNGVAATRKRNKKSFKIRPYLTPR